MPDFLTWEPPDLAEPLDLKSWQEGTRAKFPFKELKRSPELYNVDVALAALGRSYKDYADRSHDFQLTRIDYHGKESQKTRDTGQKSYVELRGSFMRVQLSLSYLEAELRAWDPERHGRRNAQGMVTKLQENMRAVRDSVEAGRGKFGNSLTMSTPPSPSQAEAPYAHPQQRLPRLTKSLPRFSMSLPAQGEWQNFRSKKRSL